ncbi:aromatic hydrocarbon degradation protein [Ectothiorhodospira shaposhnikovii]|uniref:OmpP1/FadL family transporter n=1 Tax=Ectothiorhodospira shaposhnikovii TaxID=1054 RepID=UPI001906899A|nr:outer membrane protein transport protein [Ectothiorhodospira shaposhnikovii]MBK1674489.1 aromatic hydrocarbon degradation protein [Ectothiorhodospira shaposhnikovii]
MTMQAVRIRNGLSLGVAVSLALAGGAMWSEPVKAAGFYIQEQSVSGLGRAFAGDAAIASDASTIFFNPAGMTYLSGPEVQAAVHLLVPNADARNRRSTAATPGTLGNPLPYEGGNGGNPYDPTPVPNFFYARPFNDQLWYGFGIAAPFGLANTYDKDFFARYDSTETELKVINFQPSIAYQVNEQFSVGFGLDIQYADATLKNAVPDPTRPGGPSVDTDGEVSLEADSWDYGFNLGVMFQPTQDTRLGIHYRQGIKHTLDGKARITAPNFSSPNPLLPAPGSVSSEGGEAALHLPDIVTLGVMHRLNDRWTLLGQYSWFKWSNFDEIRVKFDSARPDSITEQNYKNTWALSIGAEYRLDDRWTLRGGMQYDRTPTQDDYRTTRTPDGDRTWFSFGASYQQGPHWGFDLAYTYIDISKESLVLTRPFFENTLVETEVSIDGTTRGHVHILAAAMRYNF